MSQSCPVPQTGARAPSLGPALPPRIRQPVGVCRSGCTRMSCCSLLPILDVFGIDTVLQQQGLPRVLTVCAAVCQHASSRKPPLHDGQAVRGAEAAGQAVAGGQQGLEGWSRLGEGRGGPHQEEVAPGTRQGDAQPLRVAHEVGGPGDARAQDDDVPLPSLHVVGWGMACMTSMVCDMLA